MNLGIVELYCGSSGKKGFYNSQEIGLARAMKRLGHRCTIFYPDPAAKEKREEPVEEDILVVYLPAKAIGVHGRYDWNRLLDYPIEAVQLGSDNQLFAPDFVRWCDKKHIPVYNFIGTTGSDGASGLKRMVMGLAYRRNLAMLKRHKCFVKTDTVRRQLEDYGVANVTVAPVGLDLSIIPAVTETKAGLRRRLGLPETERLLLFVGRIDPYKRPLEAVELMSRLPEGYQLVMIGTGSMDSELDAAIAASGKADKIHRILRLPNEQVQAYYAAADWYINFNREEIFGMSILEALYQGCTVLACHAPGPDYIIEDGISGYLTANPAAMAALIRAGKTIPAERARNRVLDAFTWDNTAAKFDRWLQSR